MFNNDISLLQYITSKEVEDLIIEYELMQKGYEIKYFIDNYDIGKYSFPMGLLPKSDYDNRSKLPIEIITDEQLAYYYIINKEKKFYLFDEHIEELNQYIRKINFLAKSAEKNINALEEFLIYFNKKNEILDLTKKNNFLNKFNVSLIISIALGALYDGKKKIIDLKKKLIINDEESGVIIQNYETIVNCRPTKMAETLFEKLKIQLRIKIINRSASRYNKCKVYERLICINNKTKKEQSLYFLLSSSKILSDKIPNIANLLQFNVSIDDKIINPIRTISQIYLKLLLSDHDNKLKQLKKIKEAIFLKEETDNVNVKEEVDKYLLEVFENKLTNLREGFENASLLLNLKNYEEDLNKALSNKALIKNKSFINSLNELLIEAKDKDRLKKIQEQYLTEIIYLREYSIILKDALIRVNNNEKILSGFSGQDYIDSPFHNLPFVFFDKTNDNFNEIINKIIKLITETNTGKISSKLLLQSVKKSFQLLFEKPMTATTNEENVIMILILLMLRKDNYLKPNEIAYSWINDILKNNQMNSSDWYIDLLYMQSWIARRVKKYDEAIKIAEKGIELNNNDPRFFQSLSLNYYCKYQDSKRDTKLLTESINNSLKAYNLYLNLLLKKDSISIQKSLIAILNSLSYQYVLKYSITKEKDLLIKARGYLYELKNSCQLFACDYEYSAEFQHTEAFIEYQEYLSSNDNDKLCFSLQRIIRALKFTDKKIYFDLKYNIMNEIEKINLECND